MKKIEFILHSVKELLGEEYAPFLQAMQMPPTRGVRINKKKCSLLPPDHEGAIPWARDAYYLPTGSTLGASILHEAGAFYLQEPSAMLAVTVLGVNPGDKVLDLCSAPGSKATQIASYLSQEGLLVANEPNKSRAQILSSNIERMGVENAIVTNAYPHELSEKWQGFFDKILVDAPCSGEGMFRKNPQAVEAWSEANVKVCVQRQAEILHHASKMLKPNGVMVYSTCTFNQQENEYQIADFLSKHPSFTLEPFTVPYFGEIPLGMLRVWPHRHKGEGHFVAFLKKGMGEKATPSSFLQETLSTADKATQESVSRFMKEFMLSSPSALAVFAGKVILPPTQVPSLNKIKVLRVGLPIGTMKGKHFIPDHALALARPFANTVPLTQEEAERWLYGECLYKAEAKKGYATPTYQSLPLGFTKISEGQLKNHYPKGLRTNKTTRRKEDV